MECTREKYEKKLIREQEKAGNNNKIKKKRERALLVGIKCNKGRLRSGAMMFLVGFIMAGTGDIKIWSGWGAPASILE